ncbi:MAG: amidohydrolase family protein [Planctomycetia bacterium]|nr:amidohydrolase family protein [Planctomycetia bacterium]
MAMPDLESRAADALYDGPIVDTHEHLWDLKEWRLPWIAGLTGKPKEILGRDYRLDDYAAASKGLNIAKSIYMEVDVAEADQVKEAEYVTKVCAAGKTPMVGAVIGGRPAADGFKDYLDRFKGNTYIKGLRQVLHTPATAPKFCLEEKFVKGVQLLGERGLIFDLCFKNDQLDFGAELVDRCPQTRFILDHCGNPHNGSLDLEGWQRGLARIAGAKNRQVMCKVSGVYGNVTAAEWPARKLAPIVRTVVDQFGWDRVMFASDWPVVNLGASFAVWVETVKEIVRGDSAANQKKLFHDNAVRFYGLA